MVEVLTAELHDNEDEVRELASQRSSMLWVEMRCGCKLHVEVLRHCAQCASDQRTDLACPKCGHPLDMALVRHCFPGEEAVDPHKTLYQSPRSRRTGGYTEGDPAVPLAVFRAVEQPSISAEIIA